MARHDNQGRKDFLPESRVDVEIVPSGPTPGKVSLTSLVAPVRRVQGPAQVQRMSAPRATAAPQATATADPGERADDHSWNAAFRPDLANAEALDARPGAGARVESTPEPGSPAAIVSQLGPGTSLDSRAAARIGEVYGASFADVRVHTDDNAARLAQSEDALAFTVGKDIAFAPGQYQPNTPRGDALLAHELAHVVQQRGAGNPAAVVQRKTASPGTGALEADADQAAVGVMARLYGGAVSAFRAIGARVRPALDADMSLQRCPSSSGGGATQAQGSTTPQGSVDHTTGEQLDTFLGSSEALGGYVSERIENGEGAAGNIRFHDNDSFESVWVAYALARTNPNTGAPFTREEAIAFGASVNAFRDGSMIHIHQDRGEPGTAIHEGIHLFSSDTYRDGVGFQANEGTTEYFARVVCPVESVHASW